MSELEEPLTVQDILAEAQGSEEQPYHSLLEVWRAILEPAQRERNAKITPQWANRICTTYREVNFTDMPHFRERYFDKITDLAAILQLEIESDDECLNVMHTEEDVEHNGPHYLNIITNWQLAFLQWELAWDPTVIDAAVELASISEVHRMFFDQTGLVNLLDTINFEMTDGDRDNLAKMLEELRDVQEAE